MEEELDRLSKLFYGSFVLTASLVTVKFVIQRRNEAWKWLHALDVLIYVLTWFDFDLLTVSFGHF